MAVTSQTSKVQYDCDGMQLVFTFAFRIFKPADLTVILTSAAGVDTVLVYGPGYEVAAAMGGYVNGGAVTVRTAYATGNKLLIIRNLAYTQELDLQVGGTLPAESLEAAIDRTVLLTQQLNEIAGRTLKIPATSSAEATPDALMLALNNSVLAAQTAQGGAETAQGLAETAQSAAETAQGLAETAQTGAETAQGLAETAQGAAEAARDAVLAVVDIPGSVIIWPLATPPTGYLECNGASLLRASYADLFSAIGTYYGAADGTHFTLPDYRGRFLRGWDHGAGHDPDAALREYAFNNSVAGDWVGTKQGDAVKAHSHTVAGCANTTGGSITGPQIFTASSVESNVTTINNPTGLETRPVNMAVMFAIKY